MTTLIKNSVIHFAKILRVYTVLALVGAGIVILAQVGAGVRHYFSIEDIALIVGVMLGCTLLVLRVLVTDINELRNFIGHIHVQTREAKHKAEETLSPEISPRFKKS